MSGRRSGLPVLVLLALLAPSAGQGDATTPQLDAPAPEAADPHAAYRHLHAPDAERQAEMERAREHFSDVVLINQHGEPMRFYSDLLQDKTVVICPFFTTCNGVCPVLTQRLAAVQERFADRLGKDLHLVSISVDPVTDTTDKIKAYADRFGAGPGWYFLSGDKQNVDWALYRIGQYVEDKEGHSNHMIVGNEPRRTWRKVFGPGPAENLIRNVEELLDPAP